MINSHEMKDLDNFSELFTDWTVKVAWVLTLVSDLMISNLLFFLLIQFDKYGEDSMKRPLHNQLTSQIAYPIIIHNILITPSWAWRIYWNPLNPNLAELVILIDISCTIWIMLSLTEALVTRAVAVTSYKHAYNIDDKFLSNFIFMFNIGFSMGSNIGLSLLGTCGLGSDELLSGIQKKTRPTSIFYQIIFGASFVISIVSAFITAAKKYAAYKKDKNLVKNINIMINDGQESTRPQFNNVKYNKPILTEIPVQLICAISISGFFLLFIICWNVNGSTSEFTKKFWFVWATNIFFRTLVPICIVVFYAKGFYHFMIKVHSNIWNQNYRVNPI